MHSADARQLQFWRTGEMILQSIKRWYRKNQLTEEGTSKSHQHSFTPVFNCFFFGVNIRKHRFFEVAKQKCERLGCKMSMA